MVRAGSGELRGEREREKESVFSILRILDLKFKLKLHTGGIGQTTAHGCSGRGARIFRYPKLPSIPLDLIRLSIDERIFVKCHVPPRGKLYNL